MLYAWNNKKDTRKTGNQEIYLTCLDNSSADIGENTEKILEELGKTCRYNELQLKTISHNDC